LIEITPLSLSRVPGVRVPRNDWEDGSKGHPQYLLFKDFAQRQQRSPVIELPFFLFGAQALPFNNGCTISASHGVTLGAEKPKLFAITLTKQSRQF
jgi:hypothetical protein